jgi:hypothetical protein
MLSTPIEHFPAPFLGLTVQPCGEPYGSAKGFLTVKVIQIQKIEQVLLSSEIYARGSYHVLRQRFKTELKYKEHCEVLLLN